MRVEALSYDEEGLVPVVAQDAETGEIRMVAYADPTAIAKTLETGLAHFFSRSRNALWKKGESSGHTMAVREVWVDCDGDTLVYLVDPAGPSCHTGADTCFFRRLDRDGRLVEGGTSGAAPTLLRLERILRDRRSSTAERSYTKALLEGGAPKVDAKIREEAGELGSALRDEPDARVSAEAADLIYHLLVGLLLREVSLREVLEALSKRFSRSGHEEKASR